MSQFEVTGDDLRGHASKVDAHAARLAQAAGAASVAMSDDAYGTICQFLPPLLNETEQAAAETLRAAQTGLAAIAGNLRATAKAYEDQDAGDGQKFAHIKDGGP